MCETGEEKKIIKINARGLGVTDLLLLSLRRELQK